MCSESADIHDGFRFSALRAVFFDLISDWTSRQTEIRFLQTEMQDEQIWLRGIEKYLFPF